MKKIITIIFAIAIFQIPTIFAQTYVENRYFHPNNSTVKRTGMYENKLLFVHEGNMYLVNGIDAPTILTSVVAGIYDNFKGSGGAGYTTEFMIDDANNVVDLDDYEIGSYKDVCKDQNDNLYFVDTDGKVFAYDEGGNHTELFDCEESYLFNGITVDDNYIITSRYNSDWDVIVTKIPKIGGDNVENNYGQTAISIYEFVTVERLNMTKEILFFKQTGEGMFVSKLENDFTFTDLFEITEINGDIRI